MSSLIISPDANYVPPDTYQELPFQPEHKVSKSGDTMTGQLTLPGGGTGNEAATVQQVVDLVLGLDVATKNGVETLNNKTFASPVISGNTDMNGNLDVEGNINFTGTARRITGDFSNATIANRVMFQTSTVNAGTSIAVLPNGTGNYTAYNLFSNTDPTNASFGQFRVGTDTGDARIVSGANGSGSFLPLTFYAGGSERLRVDPTTGNVGVGTSAPTEKLTVSGNVIASNVWAPTTVRAPANFNTTSGTYAKIADLTSLVGGTYVIEISFSSGIETPSTSQLFWSGRQSGIVGITSSTPGGLYNAAPPEPFVVNSTFHHRDNGGVAGRANAPIYQLDSDNSSAAYGNLSLYMLVNFTGIVYDLGVKAMRIV